MIVYLLDYWASSHLTVFSHSFFFELLLELNVKRDRVKPAYEIDRPLHKSGMLWLFAALLTFLFNRFVENLVLGFLLPNVFTSRRQSFTYAF